MDEIPGSIRVRTDEGNEWRYDSVERAASFYDVNRSDAIAFACEDVVGVAEAVESVLEREDLTHAQRQEIAAVFDGATRGLDVDVGLDVDIGVSD